MKDFDPSSQSLDMIARANLSEIVKNSEYLGYAKAQHPLMLNMVDPSKVATDEFAEVFQKYRWPDEHDMVKIVGRTKTYENDRDFLYHLRVYSDEPKDEGKHLNNFNVWLRTEPQEEFDPTLLQSSAYGMQPALHRAYAIAPDLMENVQTFFSETYNRFKGRPEEMNEFLGKPENADAIRAAHMTYRILGRLFKVQDEKLQLDQMFGDATSAQPLTDVHKALTK